MPTMTIAAPHQLYLLIYNYTYIACYTAPLKNTVTAVLEYLDLDCSIKVYQSFKQIFKGPLMGPFQAGAQCKMPQLPPVAALSESQKLVGSPTPIK